MRSLITYTAAVLLGLALLYGGPVSAHALPVQSIPESNAALDTSPAQVEIFFSEALEASFSEISVFDSQGERIDNEDTRLDTADPSRLSVTLRSQPEGVYTVVWKVLSTVDGHVTEGAYPFAVGNVSQEALAAAGQASQSYSISIFDVLARWLVFLSAASFVGGTVFLLLPWAAAQPNEAIRGSLQATWRRLLLVTLAVYLCGAVLSILVQAGQATSAALALPWDSDFAELLVSTRGGVLVMARLAAGLVIMLLLHGRATKRRQLLALALALLVLLSISLGSHGAALEEAFLPVLADWIHLSGASIWIGGLIYFAALLWRLREQDPVERRALIARLIPQFSRVALPSVMALGVTGLYSAVLNVGSLDAFFGTLYGQTLLTKTLLLLPMLALAAYNLLIITRRFRQAVAQVSENGTGLVTRFRRIVSLETGLAALLLLSVSVLTTLPPASFTAEPPALRASGQADELDVALEVKPGRVGINSFNLSILQDGQAVEDIVEVSLRFTPTTSNVPPSEVILQPTADGQYQVEGSFFSLPDVWQTQLSVRRESAFDAFANLSFDLAGGSVQSVGLPWSTIAGALLLVLGIAYLYTGQTVWRSRRGVRVVLSAVSPLLLLFAGLVVLARPDDGGNRLPINPIPPNADSIESGAGLYARNCVPCHGRSGKGDGPVGLTLNPPPADLIIHTAPGVHPDGQLYVWISDGFPGASTMPAFRTMLSDEERWDLVNYLRRLSQLE